jgi:arabinose-5-phosphate isomerase
MGAKVKNPNDPVHSALRTLSAETGGLRALADALQDGLNAPFRAAVDAIRGIRGRVIVTGVGKSGHVGVKIAATLASTGTPAFFVHSSEANHGDLGMITRDDVILALSWSGESAELKGIIAYSRRFTIKLVAFTSRTDSVLARESDIALILPKAQEACPHGLAPTTSTVMQLALGDALAIALLESRGFSASDFRVFHPGGSLGANLTAIADVMHTGDKVPLVSTGTSMREAILEISAKGFGCVAITNKKGALAGIITDGDLRRHMGPDLLGMSVDEVMTRNPKSVGPHTLTAKVLQLLNSSKITTVMVTDAAGKPVGIVHMHDLLRIGAA